MWNVDPVTQDIVISGFEKGIGDDPYTGLTDIKSCNISSIKGEAAVNFSTSSISSPIITGATLVSASPAFNTITYSGAVGLENGMCVIFSGGGLPGGISANTPYWVMNNAGAGGSGTCQLSFVFWTVPVTITTNGSGTFSSVNMGTPQYFARARLGSPTGTTTYYLVDSNGRVWTNDQTTTSGFWMYSGNTNVGDGTNTSASGNGLIYYEVVATDVNGGTTAGPTGYLFVFRQNVIDYVITNPASPHVLSWVYGWNPFTGGTAATSALDSTSSVHYASLLPDNRVYFCNGSNIVKIFQTSQGTIFNPTDTTTYTHTSYQLLPTNDKSQCIAPLGTDALIGGLGNVVYAWDTTSNLIRYPILLPESYTPQIVTVNTNAYLFSGNKGWIYVTNGSQVSPFKKVPDHVSNTIEPYFQWGGATYQKNRLYFGVQALTNAGTAVNGYGGLWCVDLVSNSIHQSNQMSYGSYDGGSYVSALLSIPAVANNQPLGTGLFIGWNNGANGGADKTTSTPYTGGQSYIISDAIPVGTLLKPNTPSQFEYKLSTPLLSGEKVEIQVAPYFNSGTTPTFTSVLVSNGDGVKISDNSQRTPLQKMQWMLVKTILTGKSSSPSYNRLKELRIIGAHTPASTPTV